MKTVGIISIQTLLVVLLFSYSSDVYAQASPNSGTLERVPILQKYLKMAAPDSSAGSAGERTQDTETARARTSAIRMADFYTREGKLLFGKLVSEDKNKITIEQLEESKIVISTYSKRDIDPRTLQTRAVPEYKYYMDLAEYFSGRTWDFKDDPDDFIQAIRCYEKARQLAVGASSALSSLPKGDTQDNERAAQIDEKIKQLQADREVWTREVESRAKLKKLELDAEFENRLKELQDKVNASSQKVTESVERLDKTIAEIQSNHRKLEQAISAMEQETARRLNILGNQMDANRRLVDPFYWVPRSRYPYGPGY